MEPSGWLGPIFGGKIRNNATRQGDFDLHRILLFPRRAARWGFRLLSLLSPFSAACFSLAVTSTGRESCVLRKKKKKKRNKHKPHVSCGFRIKLSSYLGMKEAERR
jgi:hypothetical protein